MLSNVSKIAGENGLTPEYLATRVERWFTEAWRSQISVSLVNHSLLKEARCELPSLYPRFGKS